MYSKSAQVSGWRWQAQQGRRLPRICKRCGQAVFHEPFCKVCGRRFSITYGEKLFFEQHGLELPKKCKDCINRKESMWSFPMM